MLSFFPAPHVECVEVMILILTSMRLQLLSAKRGAKRCRPSTSSWQCLCCSFSSSLPAHDRHEPTTPFPCVMSRSDNRLASARCAITVLGHRPPPSSRVAPVCSCSFPWVRDVGCKCLRSCGDRECRFGLMWCTSDRRSHSCVSLTIQRPDTGGRDVRARTR
jgi:hypothetical protein